MKQQYTNHKKLYTPHHFIFLPLMLSLITLGLVKAFQQNNQQLEWLLFSVVCFCILYLAIMLRQHYALGNQDRIVRLEFRLRHFELLGYSSVEVEKKLNFSQIAALRFADDSEFKLLLVKAVKDNMSADTIKKSIINWQADNMRV